MKSIYKLLMLFLLSSTVLFNSCSEDDPLVTPIEGDLVAEFGLETLPEIPYPVDNQYNPDRIELGRTFNIH